MPDAVTLVNVSDDFLRNALSQAHIPSLMNALVHITGDFSIIEGDVKPTPMMFGDPQGGIPEEERQRIQELAFEVLKEIGAKQVDSHPISQDRALQMARFITSADLTQDYGDFALSQLNMNGFELYPDLDFEGVASDERANFKVLVVGAGMSGLLAGIRLKKAGIAFEIIEKNDEVGGTWYENRYPGCRVDSPNHTYAYSFEHRDWPQHFCDRHVLLDYFQGIADKHGLRDHIRFNTEVASMRFDGSEHNWVVQLKAKDGTVSSVVANAVITAVGQLNRPKMPDLPSMENFEGPSFHSAQWDHDVDLKDKRVVIVGTGASAFQFTPEVVKEAAEVKVLLRTPPWVSVNPMYHEYISDEIHFLLNHVPYYATWFRFNMFWTTGEGLLRMSRCEEGWNEGETSVSAANDQLRGLLTYAMTQTLGERTDLIEKLTPKYPPAAKRMLIDNGLWYQSLASDKVEVIDEKIGAVNETGVALETGRQLDCDVLIYGTGFHAVRFLFPMAIYGKDGTELRQSWGDDPRAFRGITMPNYPNFFAMYGPNTNIVVNGSITFFSECEMQYILSCIQSLLVNGHSSLEVKQEPFDDYNVRIDKENTQMAWGASKVNAWYKNANGRVTQNWPGTLVGFWNQTKSVDPADYNYA